MSRSESEQRFRALYEANVRALLGYALRRVSRPDDAADVVSQTFLAAWRRLDDIPSGPDARLWLYGAARRVLANHRRGEARRVQLAERLKDGHPPARRTEADSGSERDESAIVLVALDRLADDDRELLRLVSWEGLTPTQLASALQIPAATIRTRMFRARNRLRAELLTLMDDPAQDGLVATPADDLEGPAK